MLSARTLYCADLRRAPLLCDALTCARLHSAASAALRSYTFRCAPMCSVAPRYATLRNSVFPQRCFLLHVATSYFVYILRFAVCTELRRVPLLYAQLRSVPLRSCAFCCVWLRRSLTLCAALSCAQIRYDKLHCVVYHCVPLCQLHCVSMPSAALTCVSLHCATLRYVPLRSSAFH